jgi:1-phosphofructokinase/tagatose 6-phosphate kinase
VSCRYSGDSTEESLRFGVACGAESTQHFGAGVIDPREVRRLRHEVEVETVSSSAVASGGGVGI